MRYTSLEHATVESLADLLLGERLPLDICDGTEPIVPANKVITKSLLKLVHAANLKGTLEIDPSPIRNRVLQTLDLAEERFTKQVARDTAEKANPGMEM